MKTLLLTTLLFVSIQALSQKLVVDMGSLVIHTMYQKDQGKYLKLISDTGIKTYEVREFKAPFNRVVIRANIGISYRDNFLKRNFYQVGIFAGENCLHGAIVGFHTAIGWEWKYLSIGALAGGYLQDKKLWQENDFKAHIFIPLAGARISLKKDFDGWGIELCNSLTPIMTVHQISIYRKLL